MGEVKTEDLEQSWNPSGSVNLSSTPQNDYEASLVAELADRSDLECLEMLFVEYPKLVAHLESNYGRTPDLPKLAEIWRRAGVAVERLKREATGELSRFLTPEEVAARLQVHPQSVYTWLRDGTLPGRKLGRLWRVSEDELRAHFAPPTDTPPPGISGTERR